MGTNRAIVEAIFAEAQAELDAEHHQERVAAAKAKLIARRVMPWYRRLFPYRIKLERIDP